MVQLSRLGWRLALAAAALLLLGGGTARLVASTASAGVAGTTTGVEIVGSTRTGGIERVVDVLTRGLGLPLPEGTRVHVYATREAFRRGLVQDAAMGEEGADELAAFAIGMARPGRALLNGRLADGSSEWLRLVAHELTHVSQFELAGGEGRAEQWLAEGMAEHVAFQALERLGGGSLATHRRLALVRVRKQPAFAHGRLDLTTLGSPRDFTLRHQREGSVETYHLSFLLADYLIQEHGFAKMVEYFGRLRRQSSEAAFTAAFGENLAAFETNALTCLQAVTGVGGPEMAPQVDRAKGLRPLGLPGQRSSRPGEAVARLDFRPGS